MGYLHIGGRTVSCLGRHTGFIKIERDIYRDVLNKLDWGGLYFFYGDKGLLKHETIIQQMYPITVTELHTGYVKGRERLITTRSGVYGWSDNADLHFAYRYDARGRPVRHAFLTTLDTEGARTQIALQEKETAVLKRIPLRIRRTIPAQHPVGV